MSEETIMTEKESLELIASMINKAKNRFNETGFLYLLWGWVVLGCCIIQFIGEYFFKSQNAGYIWFVTWGVLVYQVFFLRGKRRSGKARTYTDDINKFVWIVFVICSFLLVSILFQLRKYEAINPAILVMYGMPTFLSGIILKFKPLVAGGICCWLFAVLSIFINPEFQILFISGSLIAGWIIPGYLLKQKFRKSN